MFAPTQAHARDIRGENLLRQLTERDELLMTWLAALSLTDASEQRYAVALAAAKTRKLLGVRS